MTFHSLQNAESRFSGLPISEGVAVGRVCLLNESRHSNLPVYKVSGKGKEHERKRLENASEVVSNQIDTLIHNIADRIGRAEAAIFKVQKMILQDAKIQEQMRAVIETEGVNAEIAVTQTLDIYETRIHEVNNEYIKDRATDIGEIRRRLLDALRDSYPALSCVGEEHCQRGRNRIIVAKELTPSLAVELDAKHIIGFVTERGGPTSHAAILARALGIPAISRVENIHSLISCETELLINGNTGEVIIWPTEETIANYHSLKRQTERRVLAVKPLPGFAVMANISLSSEVAEALEMQAEGIGLFRTEYEFIAADRVLDEDEQFEHYRIVVKAMKGRPVTFRLLDVGGDKGASFLDLPEEPNPNLGFRGSRLLLARPELLKTQARALARAASEGPVNVLYPMIIDRQQFLTLKDIFIQCLGDLPADNLNHGVMLEVPSACLQAREILEVADFGSIGTNDLIQYLFAVDRNNELVANDYDPNNPVLWSLISNIVQAAKQTGKPISACGEAVSNPKLLRRFLDTGIRTVSVSSRLIPQVRMAISA